MAKQSAISVMPAGERDWVVREDGGRELGHYPTRQEAESVGHKLARKRGAELLVHGDGPKVQRSRPRKGWLSRLFR